MAQALYRKYRSRSFEELAGQEHVVRILQNALKKDSISHAYLFTGPRGTGKTSIARILAHAINGLEYSDKPHLDIIEIDAASNRRIEDVRDLREKVHIAPVSAKYKVYIIDEVHMLTTESFNALLKTLEEPPSHVVFILATTELHKLPPTITSRTQRFAFLPPSIEAIVAHLKYIAKQESIAIDDAALALVAEHADGSFRDSISLLDQINGIVPEAGKNISEAEVAALLGLPQKTGLRSLLDDVYAHDPVKTAESLKRMNAAGANAATIAASLIRLIVGTAGQRADEAVLLDGLIDVTRSPYPFAKLLAVLLGAAQARQPLQPQPAAAKPKTAALSATAATVVAERMVKTAKPKPIPETAPAPDAQVMAAVVQPTVDSDVYQTINEQWADILADLKTYSPPLCGTLRNAAVRQGEGGALVLAFRYSLHSKKLDNAKHKAAFMKSLRNVTGLSGIELLTVIDTAAEPALQANVAVSRTPEAAAVMAAMGGGEMIHY